MSDYDPPLVHMPGTKLTPEVLLHRTLNKVARIKAVTIVIQWDDDTFDIDWSSMKVSELCMARLAIELETGAPPTPQQARDLAMAKTAYEDATIRLVRAIAHPVSPWFPRAPA